MNFEDLQHSLAVDLVSGSGLAALLSASARKPDVGLVVAGAILGIGLSYLERLRCTLKVARSLFAVVLSARQFFSIWEARDANDGAALVAIPSFFLICSLHPGNASEYFRYARIISSALNALLLASAGVYYATSSDRIRGPQVLHPWTELDSSDGGLWQVLAVVDAAFSVAQPPWQLCSPLLVATARAVAFVVLSAAPHFLRFLLGGPHPAWLLVLLSATLVQSAQVHACHVRTQLSCSDQQRCLMLLVVASLATAYSERRGDVAHVSYAVAAVWAACVAAWVARKKFTDRYE